MGFELNKLSALKVRNLSRKGRYGDGGGLWLQVSESGSKSWLFRYMREGRARQMGLGPLHTVSLALARQKAEAARKLVLDGIDPINAKSSRVADERLRAARVMTFKQCAAAYIAAHEASWRNAKHRQQWSNTLRTYAYPMIGDLPVAAIETNIVLKILEPVWQAKPETASRVRMRIEAVLSWATVRGYRSGDNPARWRGHIDQLLPSRRKIRPVKHHPALPYRDLPAFMTRLRTEAGVAARALEFTILTACRTSEAIGARLAEFDLENAIWTVPGERMKAGREHRAALSMRAMEIVRTAMKDDGFLFPGVSKGKPLSNGAMLDLLERMGRKDLSVHGFRSTFRDWAAEQTNHPRDVAEMALAHFVGDKTEAAYRRGDLFEKRRRLAEDWALYCESPLHHIADVVPIAR
jgi:integrase